MRAPRPMRTVLATLGVLAGGLMFAGAPALAVAPEAPVTEAPTPITGTTATLKGELNPGLSTEKVTYHFAYSAGPGAACTESGLTAPVEPFPEAEGNHEKVSTPVTGLEGSTEYTVCLIAANPAEPAESTQGTSLKFNLPATTPVVVTEGSSGETPFAATLQAEINPENQPTTECKFEYGKTIFYGKGGSCEPGSLEGSSTQPVSLPLTGLEPKTTYHYRVVVKNATGEAEGEGEFETLTAEKPIVASESFSGVTPSAATLEAQVNPDYQETSCEFQYGTEASLATSTTVKCEPEHLGTGGSATGATVALTGLEVGKTYYYRVVAQNETSEKEGKPVEGEIEQFTTQGTPLVGTGEAQNMTRTTAVLSGTVSPAGAETTYHFAYVDAAGYEPLATNPYAGGGMTSGISVGSDHTVHAVGPIQVSELQPGVTYHYALVATNSVGTVTGPDATFTTSPPTPPLASTGSADSVSQLAASIDGSVDTRGLPTISQFEFGMSPYAGSLQPASITSSSGTVETISTWFDNDLQPGTTYYYRVIATNADGTSYGAEQSFTTGSFPVASTLPATPAFIPYASIAELDAREVQEGKKTPPKPLTKAQKLAKALKACTKKPKKQRAGCKRQARKKYGTSQKKSKKK